MDGTTLIGGGFSTCLSMPPICSISGVATVARAGGIAAGALLGSDSVEQAGRPALPAIDYGPLWSAGYCTVRAIGVVAVSVPEVPVTVMV